MKWNPSSFILGISFSIFLSSLGYAQGGQVGTNLNAFKVWLDVASSSVLPILPIQGALHIKNSSASPVTVRLSPGTQISFKLGNGEWRPYHPDGVPIATPAPPREFRFLAGQQVDFPIYVDSTLNGPGADLTANPGVMQIRASWGPFQTAPATITVLRPSGEDLAAYEELKRSGVSKFFRTDFVDRYLESDQTREVSRTLAKNANDESYFERINREQATWIAKSASAEGELRAFISSHPGSTYANHARLALAQMAIEGTSGASDTKKAREILTEMRKQNELFSEATHYLGRLAAKEGNQTQAAAYFQETAEKGRNPYYKAMASRHLEHIKNTRQPK